MGMIKVPKNSVKFFKENLNEIFESGNLAEGQWNKKLSRHICNLTNASYAVPTNSNGSGLVALMSLYRYYTRYTNVIIQTNTMYGVKAMVPASGCRLTGFVDCNNKTLMPSIDDVKRILMGIKKEQRENTILLLSHIGGIVNPDIFDISELCRNEKVILLEDCAHSFGATIDGLHSGLFGDAGVYSYYATKAIPGGEGGLVVTNDKTIGEWISDFCIYDRFEQKLDLGNNIRISELQALVIYSVVKECDEIINNKTIIAEKYIKVCREKNINFINQNINNHKGNYYKFIIYSNDKNIYELYPQIKTRTSPVYDYSIGVDNKLADKHICLPIWYGQDEDVTNQVLSELKTIPKKVY